MRPNVLLFAIVPLALVLAGCTGFEEIIFPKFGPELLPDPPATLGDLSWTERRVEVDDLGDGEPGGITIFEPVGAEGPRPALIWVLGVNNAPHYHQSLHEYLASWGYIVLIPDTRPISFLDTNYNGRNTAIANRIFERAVKSEFDLNADPDRIALGGYSVGGSMAALAAGREPRTRCLVMWAPSPAFWQGVDPSAVLPGVTCPSLFLLAELDIVVGDWPRQMQALMTESQQTTVVVPQGVHLFFQQPSFVDDRNPATTLTRIEQMRIGLETTRSYVDAQLGIER